MMCEQGKHPRAGFPAILIGCLQLLICVVSGSPVVGRYYHLDATGLSGETLDREVSLKELRLWLWPVLPIYCYHLLTFRRQPLKWEIPLSVVCTLKRLAHSGEIPGEEGFPGEVS